LGTFSLTGTPITDHTASMFASAHALGGPVVAVSAVRGAFAETDLRAALASGVKPAVSVIYIRPLMRRVGDGSFRERLKQFRRAQRLVRASKQALIIRSGSSLAERLAARFIAGSRGKTATMATPPQVALGTLLGTEVPATDLDTAELVCFDHISRNAAATLRLSPAHMRRAASLLPPSEPLKQDIEELLDLMNAIPPRAAQIAAGQGARQQVPPAIAHALEVPPNGSAPRIVQHLKKLSADPGRWTRYLPPSDGGPQSTGNRTADAVLRHLANDTRPADAATLQELETPVRTPQPESRLDLVLRTAMRPPIEHHEHLRAPWTARHPLAVHSSDNAAPALVLAGLAAPRTGLAQNMRMTHRACAHLGLPTETLRIGTMAPSDLPPIVPRHRILRDTVIWHLNADQIPAEMVDNFRAQEALHIGFLLWELDRLPQVHRLAMKMLDEIWVPSTFLQNTYREAFDGPVHLIRKGIDLPQPSTNSPSWAPGPRFICCFDAHSSVARKNPMAAVEAFQAAFPPGTEASLTIKSTPSGVGHWGDPEDQMTRIRARAAQDSRIRLIEQMLPFGDLLAMIQSADALVSPHRAEGFGYLPAYALMLGVPVLATDWSGTTDFCTQETAFPIAAQLVPVPKGHTIWPTPGANWAEIDRDALADAMRQVATAPMKARARALRGQTLLREMYSTEAQAQRVAARLSELQVIEPPLRARPAYRHDTASEALSAHAG